MQFQKLSVSPDRRRLINADGTPFFYLADTAWELFHRLSREDARMYLEDRAAKGFTAIQAVALAECDGLRVPNAYGRLPLLTNANGAYDPDLPDTIGEYSYWAHVDWIVGEAARLGLYIALLPTWGDKYNMMSWGKGPEVFDGGNAYRYGLWLGRRYAGTPNIIWVLGGDRPLEQRRHFEVIHGMAQGLREGDGGAHLITFHPSGGSSSSRHVHGEDWLDFNMVQSGHSRRRFNYEMIARDLALTPPKPVLDGEPGYEDHPDDFDARNGYLDAADARQFAYMALLSGACGHTYGDHSIWHMVESLPVEGFGPAHFCKTWRQALCSPGAGQMGHARRLLMSFDFLAGRPCPECVTLQLEGVMHIPVLRGDDYLLAYTAQGRAVPLAAGALRGMLHARWFDPRTGGYTEIGDCDGAQALSFTPPSAGRGNDWVLVLTRR